MALGSLGLDHCKLDHIGPSFGFFKVDYVKTYADEFSALDCEYLV